VIVLLHSKNDCWHHYVVCLSVCLSVMLCIVALRVGVQGYINLQLTDLQLITVRIVVWQLICTMMTTVFLYTHVHTAVHQHNLLADKVSVQIAYHHHNCCYKSSIIYAYRTQFLAVFKLIVYWLAMPASYILFATFTYLINELVKILKCWMVDAAGYHIYFVYLESLYRFLCVRW